jgi:hypothetical protein
MTQRHDHPPRRLVLVHDRTGEQLYAGPPAAAAWTAGAAGESVVEVAGARYRVAPGSRENGREIHAGVGLVQVVTYRVLPAGPPGPAPRR